MLTLDHESPACMFASLVNMMSVACAYNGSKIRIAKMIFHNLVFITSISLPFEQTFLGAVL
jgi:hypothetical protein